jgi:hypothetical protein
VAWSILGRMREARLEVWLEAEVVHSERIVVLWAMQELKAVSQYLPCWMSVGLSWLTRGEELLVPMTKPSWRCYR